MNDNTVFRSHYLVVLTLINNNMGSELVQMIIILTGV